jgi:hypothetical protein
MSNFRTPRHPMGPNEARFNAALDAACAETKKHGGKTAQARLLNRSQKRTESVRKEVARIEFEMNQRWEA